ncbi:predicted protein [Chaetoceros tenuissimus]|uniref:Uncharacterized protein n=1 Tax=Chaetoceros tenuissimus TaxID=426638 RepID=A0AAD3CUN3_9STRA|nr:predicted protein [Chaetoceros tenuissimus]
MRQSNKGSQRQSSSSNNIRYTMDGEDVPLHDQQEHYIRLESPNYNSDSSVDSLSHHFQHAKLEEDEPKPNHSSFSSNSSSSASSQRKKRPELKLDAFFQQMQPSMDDKPRPASAQSNGRPASAQSNGRPSSASSTNSSLNNFVKWGSQVISHGSQAVSTVIQQTSKCVDLEDFPKQFTTQSYKYNSCSDLEDFQKVPMRYTQSTPSPVPFYPVESIKRSTSTPPTFLQSGGRSAFGRVQKIYSGKSAFEPVQRKNVELKQGFEFFEEQDAMNNANDDGGNIHIGDSGTSGSHGLNAKAQKFIKEKKRHRRKNDDSNKNSGNVSVHSYKSKSSSKISKSRSNSSSSKKVEMEEENVLYQPLEDNLFARDETSPTIAYQKMNDDDVWHTSTIDNHHASASSQHISMSTSHNAPPPHPRRPANPSTKKPQLRHVLGGTNRAHGNRSLGSPSSHESSSLSKSKSSSISSNNTNSANTYSSNRSVTSSVAEADREVRDTNRREYRRVIMDDQSVQSFQSSDTTSINSHAYLALVPNSPQLREGASMPIDRYLSQFQSINGSSNASVGSGKPPTFHGPSSVTSEDGHPPAVIKPRFGSGKKIAPIPIRSGEKTLDSIIGNSSSSGSKSSGSKSSKKSKERDRLGYYPMRSSTPSPSPQSQGMESPYYSNLTSSPLYQAPVTPVTPHQFHADATASDDIHRPNVIRKQVDVRKFHLVSPGEE